MPMFGAAYSSLESDACIPHDGEEDLRSWEYGYLRATLP